MNTDNDYDELEKILKDVNVKDLTNKTKSFSRIHQDDMVGFAFKRAILNDTKNIISEFGQSLDEYSCSIKEFMIGLEDLLNKHFLKHDYKENKNDN